jgi:hypothetical protein
VFRPAKDQYGHHQVADGDKDEIHGGVNVRCQVFVLEYDERPIVQEHKLEQLCFITQVSEDQQKEENTMNREKNVPRRCSKHH